MCPALTSSLGFAGPWCLLFPSPQPQKLQDRRGQCVLPCGLEQERKGHEMKGSKAHPGLEESWPFQQESLLQ
jgi:hypothetical protein